MSTLYYLSIFLGIPSLIAHILVCSYFSIKDLKKCKSGKIQADFYPSIFEIASLAIPQIICFTALLFLGILYCPKYLMADLPKESLSIAAHTWEILLLLTTGDFLIYWYHRLAHLNQCFRKNIHDIHHTYTTVFSWAGTYLHPVEAFCAVACQIIPQIILKPHPLSCWIHMTIWTIFLDEEHSGYQVWWSPHNILPCGIGGGGALHDIHHYRPNVNYGFILSIWDYIFGTYEPISKKNKNPYVVPFKKSRRNSNFSNK